MFMPILGYSQSIEGVVKDKTNHSLIEGVVVTLSDKNDNTIDYCFSDKNGKYKVSYGNRTDSLRLSASLLGYETRTVPVGNRPGRLDFSLQPAEFQLKEVFVKPPTVLIKEDTIFYNVAALQTQNDRKIGDVLKKIPGMEVSNSGGITYQGSPINNFYIEGLDLLEKKYGIATNNIPVDAVASVEVIENHQPVKMLKNVVGSMDAAVNLKLRKDKKIHPVGTVKAGGGFDSDNPLWLLEAFGLLAEEKKQAIVMYKTNNTGENIVSELDDQTINMEHLKSIKPLPSALITNPATRTVPVEESRYLFNKTHVVTLNNLWKMSENDNIRVNIHYINDHKEENIRQYSSYFKGDSTLIIRESEQLNDRLNLLDGMITWNSNASGHFFKNALRGVAKWNNTASNIQTQNRISEQYQLWDYYFQNDLNYSKKIKNRMWNINSFVRYSSLPRQLDVTIDSLASAQSVLRSGFYTENSTYFSYGKGPSLFKLDLSLKAAFDNLDTDLEHNLFPESSRNDLHSNFVETALLPNYRFNNGTFSLSLDLPIVFDWLQVSGIPDESGKNEYPNFFFNPAISMKYKLKGLWEFYVQSRYNQDIGDLSDFIIPYVMTGYRNLRNTSGILSKNKSLRNTLRLNYKDPLKGFYFNLSGFYRHQERNLVNKQGFIGDLSVSGNLEQENSTSYWGANSYIGKNFYKIGTLFALTANYTRMESNKWQQGSFYPLQSEIWSLIPKIGFNLKKHFNVNYEGIFTTNYQSITNTSGMKSRNRVFQASQKVKVYYFLNEKIELKLNAEYLDDELSEDLSTNLLFLDCGASYKYKRMEINLAWNNILDEKEYSYSLYNDLDTYSYSYKLRPQSFLVTVSFSY